MPLPRIAKPNFSFVQFEPAALTRLLAKEGEGALAWSEESGPAHLLPKYEGQSDDQRAQSDDL